MASKLHPDWRVVDNHHLERTFKFPDFATALAFVNRVGARAEEAQHHPDIELGWGKVVLKLRTHDENKVGDKDYALAAHIDAL
jgi:4a-hydroxytetrahydrobiopterin dehydratase